MTELSKGIGGPGVAIVCFLWLDYPPVGLGVLILEVARSHRDTSHSVGGGHMMFVLELN